MYLVVVIQKERNRAGEESGGLGRCICVILYVCLGDYVCMSFKIWNAFISFSCLTAMVAPPLHVE